MRVREPAASFRPRNPFLLAQPFTFTRSPEREREPPKMADFLPDSDNDLAEWLANFLTVVQSRPDNLGMTAQELADLQEARANFGNALQAHRQAQAIAATAMRDKQQARDTVEKLVRTAVRRLQTHPSLTDGDRSALRIGSRSTPRTPPSAPTTRPTASIDASQRLRHTINFSDEATPNRRAKPDGVLGCEIYVKVGEAPAGPSEMRLLALDTATPYLASFDEADAGKTAHYLLRWVNSRSDPGPWSMTLSATIQG